MCNSLDDDLNSVREKYKGVLNYFGEEASMTSHEFFSTLYAFIQV